MHGDWVIEQDVDTFGEVSQGKMITADKIVNAGYGPIIIFLLECHTIYNYCELFALSIWPAYHQSCPLKDQREKNTHRRFCTSIIPTPTPTPFQTNGDKNFFAQMSLNAEISVRGLKRHITPNFWTIFSQSSLQITLLLNTRMVLGFWASCVRVHGPALLH